MTHTSLRREMNDKGKPMLSKERLHGCPICQIRFDECETRLAS